jgi:hypothetical protein
LNREPGKEKEKEKRQLVPNVDTNAALYFFLSLATFSQPDEDARQSIQSPAAERARLRQRSISATVDPKKASICL